MTGSRGLVVLLFTMSAALVVACENDAPDPDGSLPEARGVVAQAEGSPEPANPGASSGVRVALPGLYSIMVGLDGDMARVSRGLWLERFDTVAVAARAVANHPRVPPEEFDRISEVLGPDMGRFGSMDMTVHDLAVRLAEEARKEDLEAVLSTDAELRRACVRCHSTFRERIREGIR